MQKEILVSQRVYPLEVIYKAAHVYLDRCYVLLEPAEKDRIRVRLRGKPECTRETFLAVVGEFENELLNQALRLKVSKRTEKLRNAIVHSALFSALPESLDLSVEEGNADYLEDPLGIAVPWEEKFAKDKKEEK